MVLTDAKYLEKRDINSVDKSHLCIMFNGLQSRGRVELARKKYLWKEWLFAIVKQMMKRVLDWHTDRNVPTATTNLPNKGSGVPGGMIGVRTHPLQMLSPLFSNVKCPFLPIISFFKSILHVTSHNNNLEIYTILIRVAYNLYI